MSQIAVDNRQVARGKGKMLAVILHGGASAHRKIDEVGIISLSVERVVFSHEFMPRKIDGIAERIFASFSKQAVKARAPL